MMNADREPNRLPLRAGAMLLFAVAIVFIGLGWRSAATADSDPEAGLEAAARSNSATASAAPSATAGSSSAADGSTRVCVINAGSVSGLAAEVTDNLQQQGFQTASPANYDGGGFTENTIYYGDSSERSEAQRVAQALGGDASVEERPTRFSLCRDGIPVIVVTR